MSGISNRCSPSNFSTGRYRQRVARFRTGDYRIALGQFGKSPVAAVASAISRVFAEDAEVRAIALSVRCPPAHLNMSMHGSVPALSAEDSPECIRGYDTWS